MYIEYTKYLTGRAFNDMRIAIREREDNLLIENATPEQEIAINRLASGTFMRVQDYFLLNEMAAQTTKLWSPGQQLLVYFFGGTAPIRSKVLSYAQEWSNYCSITFLETKDIKRAHLRVGFFNDGSWSFIGTDARGVSKSEPTINFGWLNTSLPDRDFKQVVLHEFGHALGLIHEHQSPAATVKWNKPYVYNYCYTVYRWTKQDVDVNIINTYETSSTQYSALDTLSIMGYSIPPGFTLDGQVFPLNYDLSAMDKLYIGTIYQ